MTVHALSFDIEDWFHLVEVPAVEDPGLWPDLPSLVVERTGGILDLLAEHRARATFFVLGWIAGRYPGIVRRIAEGGHEIGTHGFWHRKVYEQDPRDFGEDVERSARAIEDACGVRPRAYRAPSFSIVPGTEWAFDVLLDLGFAYDASLFPARRGHGGYPCPDGPHWMPTPRGRRIRELPMSVTRFGPLRLCYSGGGYLRLLPGAAIDHGIRREAEAGRPTVVYLHPRDFAPGGPRVPMPPVRRFKCTVGLSTTEGKLRRILRDHAFAPCGEVLDAHLPA